MKGEYATVITHILKRIQFTVSSERISIVQEEITVGSEPGPRFYIMVAVSTLIAALGLITNSTAVVIGAMLVAPLMTPIFGLALALIRGDAQLLGKSMQAEIGGVVVAVAVAFILGKIAPALEPTPEMLARTTPNLFDLMVAVFAGFAGAYALVDEKISPALPGVAIATAIVPPLANTGLCFAVGSYVGGGGSFLLFFANFLSILLVAAATFWIFGLARWSKPMGRKEIVKRFGLACFCFFLVVVFLSATLLEMAEKRHLHQTVFAILTEELAALPATDMDDVIVQRHNGTVYALVVVNAPNVLSPLQVKGIETHIAEALKTPTELIIRNRMATDVSGYGSESQVVARNLDGFFVCPKLHPNVARTQAAEKIIRDYLSSLYGMLLHEVDLLQLHDRRVILATINGVRSLTDEEFEQLQTMIRLRLKDDTLKLVVRFVEYELMTDAGGVRFEWATLSKVTAEQRALYERALSFLRKDIDERGGLILANVNGTMVDGVVHFLIELTGTTGFLPEEVRHLEQRLAATIGTPVCIQVWFRPEYVVDNRGFTSFKQARQAFLKKRGPAFAKEFDKILYMVD